MLQPRTIHQVDPHQVTSDFAGICDRLKAKPAVNTVPKLSCPRLLWSIALGIGHHEGSCAFVALFYALQSDETTTYRTDTVVCRPSCHDT
eukprot:16233063-Heterocapsa_arctica.AAC.1